MQLVDKNHKIQAYLAAPVESGYASYVCVYQDITDRGTTTHTVAGNITTAGYYDIIPGPTDSNTIRNIVSIDISNEATGSAALTVSFVDSDGSAYPIGIKTVTGNSNWSVFLGADRWDRAGTILITDGSYKLQSFVAAPVVVNPVYYVAVYQDINNKGATTYTVGGTISGITPSDTITGPVNSNTTRKILSLNFCNADTSAAVVTVSYITDQTQVLGVKSIPAKGSWEVFSTEITSTGGGGTGTVTSVGLSAGTGITIGGTNPVTTSGTITVTNSAPDQVVSLTAGTGINVTGAYPNFTVTNTSPSSGGTVTSVATSSPITGGTITGSGTIGITQATSGTDGYLSSADWNTFNSKQGAITLTTTGTTGPATLISNTLNIPQYGGGGVTTNDAIAYAIALG